MAACSHASDEDTGVRGVTGDPGPVPQQRPPASPAGGIHRNNPDGLMPIPVSVTPTNMASPFLEALIVTEPFLVNLFAFDIKLITTCTNPESVNYLFPVNNLAMFFVIIISRMFAF